MKRILLSAITLLFACFTYAATIKWDGDGNDGLWATAVNWDADVVPGAGDNVVLDNFIVAGSYTVYLPNGAASTIISSLTITPFEGNNIILILPTANTSSTGFFANGPGNAVVLNSGAIFINESGASGGTTVSVDGSSYFRINDGGKYIHRTIRAHTDLIDRLSTAVGTEKGVFEFDIPAPTGSATISLSGNTFGTLVLSSVTKGSPVTYSGTGASPLNINGDLIINAGVTFSIGFSANIIIYGNYQQSATSEFNLQNNTHNNLVRILGNINSSGTITKSGSGLPVLELSGTTNQNVSMTGNITNSVSLKINNPSGVTLLSPVSLPYNLNLQNGKVKNTANILTLTDGATVTGGSVNSFVEGPMRKVGADATFSFPVGKGSIYAPISFNSSGMAPTDAFEAEYFRLNPQNLYGRDYKSPVHHVSYVEYWRLDKVSGSTLIPAKITLPVTQYSFAKQFNTIDVAIKTSPQWENTGINSRLSGPDYPPYVTGSITSGPVTGFGIFTLGTNQPEAINPLPVTILSFKAIRVNATQSTIKWQVEDYYSDRVQFAIERSINRNEFVNIKTINADASSHFYSATDNNTNERNIRYRVRITNEDGKITYSNIILLPDEIKLWEAGIYPNPVIKNAIIRINSLHNESMDLKIFDAVGKLINYQQQRIYSGENQLWLHTNKLIPGVYFLTLNDGSERKIIRFVKQ